MNSILRKPALTTSIVLLLIFALPFAVLASTEKTANLATPEEDTNKELAGRWVSEFFLTGSMDAALDMASPDFVAHDLAGRTIDLDDFTANIRAILAGTTDRSSSVTGVVAENNLVAIHWNIQGVRTRQSISPWILEGIGLLRMENGQIVEMWLSYSMRDNDCPHAELPSAVG